MAEGILKSLDTALYVRSAGTLPEKQVNPMAVEVMKEIDIDISENIPESVDKYIDEDWDYVITVCGDANDNCPVFPGKVKSRMHIGFSDPSKKTGDRDYLLSEFRKTRDEIFFSFGKFLKENR